MGGTAKEFHSKHPIKICTQDSSARGGVAGLSYTRTPELISKYLLACVSSQQIHVATKTKGRVTSHCLLGGPSQVWDSGGIGRQPGLPVPESCVAVGWGSRVGGRQHSSLRWSLQEGAGQHPPAATSSSFGLSKLRLCFSPLTQKVPLAPLWLLGREPQASGGMGPELITAPIDFEVLSPPLSLCRGALSRGRRLCGRLRRRWDFTKIERTKKCDQLW